jgi:hypothetical protein
MFTSSQAIDTQQTTYAGNRARTPLRAWPIHETPLGLHVEQREGSHCSGKQCQEHRPQRIECGSLRLRSANATTSAKKAFAYPVATRSKVATKEFLIPEVMPTNLIVTIRRQSARLAMALLAPEAQPDENQGPQWFRVRKSEVPPCVTNHHVVPRPEGAVGLHYDAAFARGRIAEGRSTSRYALAQSDKRTVASPPQRRDRSDICLDLRCGNTAGEAPAPRIRRRRYALQPKVGGAQRSLPWESRAIHVE